MQSSFMTPAPYYLFRSFASKVSAGDELSAYDPIYTFSGNSIFAKTLPNIVIIIKAERRIMAHLLTIFIFLFPFSSFD